MNKIGKLFIFAALIFSAVAIPCYAQMKKVAIGSWGPHPSLEEATSGFKKGLAFEGFREGQNVIFDESHANFDRAVVPPMLSKLASASPDLMLLNAQLPYLGAPQLKARSFPIVFTIVTDPVGTGLLKSWTSGGPLITGSTLAIDDAAVLQFFRSVLPNLKRLGVIYDTADEGSVLSMQRMEKIASLEAVSLLKLGVDSPADLPQRVQFAIGKVDAVYVVANGRIAQAAPVISNLAERGNLPILTTVPEMVKQNQALAALGLSFEKVGYEAGLIAGRILKGADPQSIPPWRASAADHTPFISEARLKMLRLTLPAPLKDCGCFVK